MNKRSSILLFLSLLSCLKVSKGLEERIHLYALCTKTHEELRDQWFLPTIQDDYEVIIKNHHQECPSGMYNQAGWMKVMLSKVDLIIKAIQENWNKILIVSDVDIQFFRPTQKLIVSALQDKDIVIQRESPSGQLCAGFFACWGNKKTLKLWQEIKKLMQNNQANNDQHGLNLLLKSKKFNNPYNVQWDYLPVEFFGGGVLTGKAWHPGKELPVPDNIVMHHANFTTGMNNKIAQLRYVRKVVNSR